MRTLYLTCTILSMIWTLGDFNSVYLLTGGGPADLTHVLATLGIRYLRLDLVDLSMAAIVSRAAVLPLVYFAMHARRAASNAHCARWDEEPQACSRLDVPHLARMPARCSSAPRGASLAAALRSQVPARCPRGGRQSLGPARDAT